MPLPEPAAPAPHDLFHAITPADRAAMAAIRQALAAAPALPGGAASRAAFDAYVLQTPADPTVRCAAATVGGVSGWWYRPAGAPADCAVLYLHGGAYVAGSAAAYRHFGSQLAGRVGVDFFAPDYRLAPEHPFPAAVADATAAYQGLADLGKQRLALSGDSAGGGLALVLLANLGRLVADPRQPTPRAAAVLSSWTDLALTSPSLATQAASDLLLSRALLTEDANLYLGGHDARDPQASPVYGDLRGLPPVQLHVGTADVLLDDTRRYAAQARAGGVPVECHVWEDLLHVFAASVGTLEAAGQALDRVAGFLRRHLGE